MTTSKKTGSAIILALLVGVLAAVWLFFAPPQLLGSTTYTATDGNSMQPMFHKALTRPASSYRVGEVVLYMSPTLHRPVLHRIIAIQNGHYFFKGDHNDFVDPGYATKSELIGHLWLHVAGGGKPLSWIAKPTHAAVLASLATILLVMSGAAGTARSRRRRRNRRGAVTAFTAPAASSNGLPRWLHKPRKTIDNFIAGGALVLGLLLVAVGFMTPLRKSAPVNAYSQIGSFNYSAAVEHADPAYPTGTAQTGQPLFLNDFKTATLSFAYQFKSSLKHNVHGTISFAAQLSSDTTWHRNVTIMPAHKFNGDLAVASGNVDLNQLRALLTKLGQDSGDAGASYAVTLVPIVTVHGTVGGKQISDTFTPTLPFSVSNAIAKLNVAGPATLPGASYATESPADVQASALQPTKTGTIPGNTARFFTFARYNLPVSDLRGIGIGLLGLFGLILLLKPLKPKREVWSPERRVAFRYGSIVVDVERIESAGDITTVRDFENLALMARYLERPIYKAIENGIETYAVEDGGRMHIFRRPESKQPEIVERMETLLPPEPTAPRKRPHLRIVAAVLTLVGLVAVGTAFTAATVVPQSNVGVSTHASSAAQLAPAACTGSITNVFYVPSGNKSQTVTTSNTLIIGSSGQDTVTAGPGSGYQCFIGGGPTSGNSDKYTGRAGQGSQCVVATTDAAGNIKNCTIVTRSP
jgi:signal peptidase I